MSIRRGSTPSFTVKVSSASSIPVSDLMAMIEDFYITFEQTRKGNSVTKHGADLTWLSDGVSFYLTQAETLSLDTGICEVQVKLNLTGDKAMLSDITEVDIEKALYEEVV